MTHDQQSTYTKIRAHCRFISVSERFFIQLNRRQKYILNFKNTTIIINGKTYKNFEAPSLKVMPALVLPFPLEESRTRLLSYQQYKGNSIFKPIVYSLFKHQQL